MRREWQENFARGCRHDGVCHYHNITNGFVYCSFSEVNIIAMRLGPGKHLRGRTLLRGIINPEDFDYFYEVCVMSVVADSFLILPSRLLSIWNSHE